MTSSYWGIRFNIITCSKSVNTSICVLTNNVFNRVRWFSNAKIAIHWSRGFCARGASMKIIINAVLCAFYHGFGYSCCCSLKSPERSVKLHGITSTEQSNTFVRVLFKDEMVRINSHCNRNGFTVPEQISSKRFSAWNDLSSTWYCSSSRSHINKKKICVFHSFLATKSTQNEI